MLISTCLLLDRCVILFVFLSKRVGLSIASFVFASLRDWDQVLFHIAERSSLNHFILCKAFKVSGAQGHPYHPSPTDIKLWYSKTCDLEGSDGIRQGLEKFVGLQEAERRMGEAERQAKEAILRARALERLMNKRAAPSRRSSRIASQRAADNQKEETEG